MKCPNCEIKVTEKTIAVIKEYDMKSGGKYTAGFVLCANCGSVLKEKRGD